MPVTLPLEGGTPNYRVSTTLSGIQYIFDVRYNTRIGVWYLDIRTEDDEPISVGAIAIVLGTFLGVRVADPRMPPGMLVAVDLSGESRDATFDDLGTRVAVFYYTPEELAAL